MRSPCFIPHPQTSDTAAFAQSTLARCVPESRDTRQLPPIAVWTWSVTRAYALPCLTFVAVIRTGPGRHDDLDRLRQRRDVVGVGRPILTKYAPFGADERSSRSPSQLQEWSPDASAPSASPRTSFPQQRP